jgi:hypothetical protein
VPITNARVVTILWNEDYYPIAQVGWHFASLQDAFEGFE